MRGLGELLVSIAVLNSSQEMSIMPLDCQCFLVRERTKVHNLPTQLGLDPLILLIVFPCINIQYLITYLNAKLLIPVSVVLLYIHPKSSLIFVVLLFDGFCIGLSSILIVSFKLFSAKADLPPENDTNYNILKRGMERTP